MVAAHLTKRVLRELSKALPDEGSDLLTHLSVRRGWGDIIFVRIHADTVPRVGGIDLRERFINAVDAALVGHRHRLDIEWAPYRR